MKIFIIINGWTTKMSGGDYHILKVAQFWSQNHEIKYILPKLGYYFSKNILQGDFIISNTIFEKETSNPCKILLLYILRSISIFFNHPKESPDVVISSSHFLCDVLPIIYFRIKEPSCIKVLYYHGLKIKSSNILLGYFRLINDFLAIFFINHFYDLVITVNPVISDYLARKGCQPEKIILTDNGINLSREIDSKVKKDFTACFIGRIVKSKGIYDLIDIWSYIIKEIPSARLAIIGDGPELSNLKGYAKTKNIDGNIKFFGHLNDERFDILSKSKLFVFPSYGESWAIVILEAMSLGIPIITYDLAELRHIWGDFIIYSPKEDHLSFSKKIFLLLKSEDIYNIYSASGIKKSREYSWEAIAHRELNFFLGGK